MAIRDHVSAALVIAASGARRFSHGLLFAAGGVRRVADFKRDVASYFEDFLTDPDEIAGGFNAFEARIYGRHVAAGARICVIGCGTGRDLLPFVAAGHEVVGLEPAPGPVAILRRELAARRAEANIIQGFVEDAPIPGRFDAIVLSPHCYSYIPGAARRVAVLAKLREHLTPEGRLLINFLRRTGDWSRAGVTLAAATARLSGSDCPWEAHDTVQLTEHGGRASITFEHFFLPVEVEAEATRAGLRVVGSEVDSFLGALAVFSI
jgi:SAM-dependent methyltransferase